MCLLWLHVGWRKLLLWLLWWLLWIGGGFSAVGGDDVDDLLLVGAEFVFVVG